MPSLVSPLNLSLATLHPNAQTVLFHSLSWLPNAPVGGSKPPPLVETSAAEPCLHPDATCSEHVAMGKRFLIVYRNSTIDRALIMVQGAQRNSKGHVPPAFRGRPGPRVQRHCGNRRTLARSSSMNSFAVMVSNPKRFPKLKTKLMQRYAAMNRLEEIITTLV